MEEYVKIVVTGEVDSGKSTLIGRFVFEMDSVYKGAVSEIMNTCAGLRSGFKFAYLIDSLEEERKGKLTIDTTQIFCRENGKGFLFIDVPGHRQLLKNTLCGSTYADMAIVVVDVNRGIEEGTKRHIHILKFLGIKRIVVVLNKMDLVHFNQEAFSKMQIDIEHFLKMNGMEHEQIIPVSAAIGDNLIKRSKRMSWYKGATFLEVLRQVKKSLKINRGRDFYFVAQDVYHVDGNDFVVGPILSGKVRKGQSVKIVPGDKKYKIKKIRMFGQQRLSASAPASVGLALSESGSCYRGQVIYVASRPEVTMNVNAKIFCIQPVCLDDTFIFRCLSQETPVKITKILRVVDASSCMYNFKAGALDEATVVEVVMATQKPVVTKKYTQLSSLGRFVLEDNHEICAAGIIV